MVSNSTARRGFDRLYNLIAPRTLVDRQRCELLFGLSRQVASLPGDMAELGVFRGGTSVLLAKANPHKLLHAFDTFTGLSNAVAGIDGFGNGDFAADAAEVVPFLQRSGVRAYVGFFPETARDIEASFCFAHFDGDTCRSALDFLDFFYPRLVTGGVLVLDDYLDERCPGVRQAVDRWARSRAIWPIVPRTNQCIILKSSA